MAAMGFVPPSQAFPGPPDEGLPNVDLRTAERAPVLAETRAARIDLADDLGPFGEVKVARKSGAVAYVGRSDGLLTAPSARPPREIVLEYVRAHDEVFGLDERDIANLQLVARTSAPTESSISASTRSKRRPRGAQSCTRQLPAATGTVALHTPGQGTLQLSAAGLGKGRYAATLTAVDATGNASTPVVVRFTVG